MKKLINGQEVREHRVEYWLTWNDEQRGKVVKKIQKFLDSVKTIEDYDILINGTHLIVRTTELTLALKAYAYGAKMMDTTDLVSSVELKVY